jgi:hypothetical protein
MSSFCYGKRHGFQGERRFVVWIVPHIVHHLGYVTNSEHVRR